MKKQAFTLVELIVVITILAILSTIAFISLSGYSKEARDSKRISDTRNLLTKINVEQTKGKPLSELIINTRTESGKILGVSNSTINTFGVSNFDALKEDSKAFKDPLIKTQDYPVAYAVGGTGSGAYKFFEIATISEKENTTKIMGNYFKQETTDVDSLFLTGGLAYKEGDIPIYNVNGGLVETPTETPVIPEMEIVEVFGDENTEAIAACNKWVQDNVGTQGGGSDNWLWVPASKFTKDGVTGIGMDDSYYKREVVYNNKKYICNGFAVARYEMTYEDATTPNSTIPSSDWNTYVYNSSKTLISRADRYPVVQMTQPQALTACNGIGSGFHLITNNEWMTIARNIELRSDNWSSGIVGNGYVQNGLSNDSTRGCAGVTNTVYISLPRTYGSKTGVGTGIGTNEACDTKRQLTLSNNEKIWDLVGNIREHVNKANTPIDGANYNSSSLRLSNACGGTVWYSLYGNDGQAQCTYANGYTYSNVGPATPSLNAVNGMGRIYSYNSSNIIFLRSGGANAGMLSGLYTIHLSRTLSNLDKTTGIRCSL